MELRRYVRHCIPDYLLTLVLAVGLAVNVYQGFLLPAALSGGILRTAAISALLLIPLFVSAYSKKTAAIGTAAGGLALVLALVVLARGGGLAEDPDPEKNAALWYVLCVLCTLAVFLLGRTVTGSGVLLVGGALVQSLLAFLGYIFYLWALVAFLWAGGTLFFYKRYRRAVLTTHTARTAFGAMAGVGALVSAACIGLSALVWFALIAPLDPPSQELKLVTQMVSVEVVDRIGISRQASVLAPELTSEDTDEQEQRLSDNLDGQEEQEPEDEPTEEDPAEEGSPEDLGVEEAAAVSYDLPENFPVLLLVLAVLLTALAVLAVVFRRRLWLRRIQRLPRADQVRYLYAWFVKKLPVLGLAPMGADTPHEYARQIASHAGYLAAEGATWEDLTGIYVRHCYGGMPITDEQYRQYISFYRAFHRNCRKILGGRYVYKYFLL